ncbi:histidine phosphatase family protein [Pseudonocardia nematodicida]|uniref:Histidine phosphatase family protein n=1 Tax=Pseudonocardia nematodicida TaxID=1206997 RepID=A0ABV1KEF7_9PSEU
MNGTRLLLTRHSQAHCNVDGVSGGPRGCTGLTPHGRTEATLLAHRLAHLHTATPIAAVYASPLRRVRETADLIEYALGMPAITVDGLREPDYGTADGLPWTPVVSRFAAIPAHHPRPADRRGAETWEQHYDRAAAALQSLLARHRGESIAVIAHGGTVTAAAHLFLDLPATARAQVLFTAHNASITTWEQQPLSWTRPDAGQRWALIGHNDTAHLASPQVPAASVHADSNSPFIRPRCSSHLGGGDTPRV